LLMYATTVIYPLSSLTGKMYFWVSLNPMTYVLEGIRRAVLGSGVFDLYTLSYAVGSSIVILFFGLFVFNKVEKSFVDTI
jgi:lipopolysaccharide transport system permease protein